MLSESLLHSLLASCTLSNSVRPADVNIFRPQYMRTLLPVSSLGAYGATPSEHSLPPTAFLPSDPKERVAESIRLIAESRAQSRGYHQSQPPRLAARTSGTCNLGGFDDPCSDYSSTYFATYGRSLG